MSIVKTAISVDESLLRRAETLARSLKTSQSGLFALALSEFLKRHENQRMLEDVNASYASEEDASEKETRKAALLLVAEVADEW